MGRSLLADALVVVHFSFTLFVIFGGFLVWLRRWVLYAHLPALAWGCWIELSGRICPLTPLENLLRRQAGEAGYGGGFLQHYIIVVLYPPGLTRQMQWGLAVALVAINVVAYAVVWRRWRSRAAGLRS
ncbi:MAG TPA: DUF2784 domain-containing protein [Steroidobacteraceae bacterium]|nr:DUF2784 domain-containing protein [Steroidobacteraceae bacterium]